MKTILKITLLLICPYTFLFSQSKKETQDWIKEKIEMFGYSDEVENFGHKYLVSFNETEMILTKTYYSNNNYQFSLVTNYVIPIKDLNTIFFEEKISTTWMIISLKENKNNIKETFKSDNSVKYINKISLIFSKSVNDSDMKGRFIKAFKHLVKIHGGVIIDEKF